MRHKRKAGVNMAGLNYQKNMEELIKTIPEGTGLLVHSCCGPCSTSVLEQLAGHFRVVLYFYNPNIWPKAEYDKRLDTQRKLLDNLKTRYPVEFAAGEYNPDCFLKAASGLEAEPEGGARCGECFVLRLEEAAKKSAGLGLEWYTTTLTVSPHKNARLINQLGNQAGEKYGVKFLPSDFKKKDGYKRSIQLSSDYQLYRQEYCGCEFSYNQRFGPDKP